MEIIADVGRTPYGWVHSIPTFILYMLPASLFPRLQSIEWNVNRVDLRKDFR